MNALTRIEKLDQKLPGLADKVRGWFNEGLSAQRVSELLREQFALQVPRSTVGNFRARRWMHDRQMACDRQSLVQAAQAYMQEVAMMNLPRQLTPHDVRLTTYFILDEDCHLDQATETEIEYGPGWRESGDREIR